MWNIKTHRGELNGSLIHLDLSNNYTYCGPTYDDFWVTWLPDDYVLTVNFVICTYGLSVNILNLIVFSHKSMRSNPINLILGGISLCDLLIMSTFIPTYFARLDFFKLNYPYFEPVAYIIYWNILQVFHAIAIWLTMLLAVSRFIAVVYPLRSRSICTMHRTKVLMILIFVIVIILCIPTYLTLTIRKFDEIEVLDNMVICTHGVYCVTHTDLIRSYGIFVRKYELWCCGLGCRLVPCFILTYVSIHLLTTLGKSRKQRQWLTRSPSKSTETVVQGKGQTHAHGHESKVIKTRIILEGRAEDKTTKMLVVVLVIFLVTEFPPGLILTIMTLLPLEFEYECCARARFLWLTFITLSGALNFNVFLMSRNFRQTLCQLCTRRRRDSDRDLVISKESKSKWVGVNVT